MVNNFTVLFQFLIITSSVLVAVCMASLAVLTQIKIGPGWLSALLILLYCFFFSFGAGTVPYVLLAEVFVPEVSNISLLLSCIFCLIFLSYRTIFVI